MFHRYAEQPRNFFGIGAFGQRLAAPYTAPAYVTGAEAEAVAPITALVPFTVPTAPAVVTVPPPIEPALPAIDPELLECVKQLDATYPDCVPRDTCRAAFINKCRADIAAAKAAIASREAAVFAVARPAPTMFDPEYQACLDRAKKQALALLISPEEGIAACDAEVAARQAAALAKLAAQKGIRRMAAARAAAAAEEEIPPDVECPEGYYFEPELGECIPMIMDIDAVPPCPEGSMFDPVSGACVPSLVLIEEDLVRAEEERIEKEEAEKKKVPYGKYALYAGIGIAAIGGIYFLTRKKR